MPAKAPSWVSRDAIGALPEVTRQQEWMSTSLFDEYMGVWDRESGLGGLRGDTSLNDSLFAQWHQPLTFAAPSTMAILRSATESLTDEALPPIFGFDIPDSGLVFLPTTLRGARQGDSPRRVAIDALAWSECTVADSPGVLISAWERIAAHGSPRAARLATSRGDVSAAYVLSDVMALVHGRVYAYGRSFEISHREETVAVSVVDGSPESLAHRVLYSLWSLLAGGVVEEARGLALPPLTAQKYPWASVRSLTSPCVDDEAALVSVRKDRVVDFFDDRHLFVWTASETGSAHRI